MSMVMAFSFDSRPIQTLINQIRNVNKRDGIDLQPKYQRPYIWNSEFKDKLIFSISKGYPIGNISLRVRSDRNPKGAMQEVVDGQQRLRTIFDFVNEKYTVQGEFSRKIIEYIIEYMDDESDPKLEKLKKRIKNKGKLALKYKQLPDAIRENIKAYNISITNITNATDEEITEYFRFLQNQERLRAGEIINSIPESALERYLDEIIQKENLLSKLSFSNDRRQFDRVFFSILGMLDKQLSFGVMDKAVLKFAYETVVLSEDAEKKITSVIEQLNYISKDTAIPVNYVKANARLMKFLLLLCAYNLVDFKVETEKKLKALDSINQQLSSFSSAKADSVLGAFQGYAKEVIEEYRLLALISKGGHSEKRVYNRMQILAYYINDFKNKTVPSGIEPIN